MQLVKKPNGGTQHAEQLPSFRYVPFLDHPSMQEVRLGSRERHQLSLISTVLKLPPRTPLFLEGDSARWVYNIADGSVCVSRTLPTGKRRVLAFIFPGDICGLARRGLYVNSARTMSPTTVMRIPVDELRTLMMRNADLQFVFEPAGKRLCADGDGAFRPPVNQEQNAGALNGGTGHYRLAAGGSMNDAHSPSKMFSACPARRCAFNASVENAGRRHGSVILAWILLCSYHPFHPGHRVLPGFLSPSTSQTAILKRQTLL